MEAIREQIAYVGKMLFERRLTDFSGGNVSARGGNRMYITPRYAGSVQHWNLNSDDVIDGPIDSDDLLTHPKFSREGRAHLEIYRQFPDANGVIHAHPFHVLPFCVAGKAIEPPLESARKFERVDILPFAPAHSQELADSIVNGLRGKDHIIRTQAAALLLSEHGIIVAGKDLLAALDAVERIDWNAWCILAQPLLAQVP